MTVAGSVMQVWDYEGWSGIPLREMRSALMDQVRVRGLPALGDMTVRQLMAMALQGDDHPIGIYIFTDGDRVMYTGKTHGRSLGERVITHLESRTPTEGGWSMACAAAARALIAPKMFWWAGL